MAKITNAVKKNIAADLRTTYMLAFDNFSTEPVEVGNAVKGNSRYGRELLGTLVQADLLTDTLVNGSDMVWQCHETYDSVEREAAEATIDAWLTKLAAEDDEPSSSKPAPARAAKPAKETNPANLPNCLCGCGQVTNRGRNYKPGHDARHAGAIGRTIAAELTDGRDGTDLLASLPTEALRIKAMRVAESANAVRPTGKGKAAKAPRSARRVVEDLSDAEPVRTAGTVKKGRWSYPAQKDENGTVWIARDRKGSDQFDEVTDAKVAATFA